MSCDYNALCQNTLYHLTLYIVIMSSALLCCMRAEAPWSGPLVGTSEGCGS